MASLALLAIFLYDLFNLGSCFSHSTTLLAILQARNQNKFYSERTSHDSSELSKYVADSKIQT